MRAKEFLNDYAVDDLDVFGRHEEHYSLDDLMEEYAKVYHENEVKKLCLSAVSGQSELLIALHNIEKICDNQNPTHEQIWRIAYEAINSH